MREIKLMADYQCFPLWEASPGIVGNIDPASLPISLGLKNLLHEWSGEYDATLNLEDPALSGFCSDAAHAEFQRKGQFLAAALQAELGEGYRIKLFV